MPYTYYDWTPRDKEALVEEANSFFSTTSLRTAILCGHYVLGYDSTSHSLMPLIPEERNALQKKAEKEADIFPLETFRLGLLLYTEMSKVADVKLLLLVNDAKVSSVLKATRKTEKESGILRKNFFHSDASIPSVYHEYLKKHQLKPEQVFLKKINKVHSADTLLPQSGFCWNEVSLQRRFSRTTSKLLVKQNVLQAKRKSNDTEVKYTSAITAEDYCVVGKGQTGCLGISIELIRQMHNEGIERLIVMIPDTCIGPMNDAAEIAQHIITGDMIIACIGGLEEMDPNLSVRIHKIIHYDKTHDRTPLELRSSPEETT